MGGRCIRVYGPGLQLATQDSELSDISQRSLHSSERLLGSQGEENEGQADGGGWGGGWYAISGAGAGAAGIVEREQSCDITPLQSGAEGLSARPEQVCLGM